jgi:hypothetical protein
MKLWYFLHTVSRPSRVNTLYRITAVLAMTCVPAIIAQDPLHGWTVQTTITAMKLVAVDESEKFTTFRLQNVSSKVITAFALSFEPPEAASGVRDYRDCNDDEPSCVRPGGILEVRFGPMLEGRTLWIRAVVFEDGTSDGNESDIRQISSNRLGLALERERLNGIFARYSDDDLDDAGLARLTEEIGPVPNSPNAAFASLQDVVLPGVSVENAKVLDKMGRFSFFVGVKIARRTALTRVARLRTLPVSAEGAVAAPTRAFLLRLVRQKYENFSARSHAYYERIQKRGGQ